MALRMMIIMIYLLHPGELHMMPPYYPTFVHAFLPNSTAGKHACTCLPYICCLDAKDLVCGIADEVTVK